MEYLSSGQVRAINQVVLEVAPAKKADHFKVLSEAKLEKIIKDSKRVSGDAWDVAVFLLKRLVQDMFLTVGIGGPQLWQLRYFS